MGQKQFSLRLLLAAIAAVGIGAALWVAKPSWQVGILQSLVVMAAPPCILTATMHQQGANRAFLLGATFVAAISTVTYSYQLANECRVLLDRNWARLPVGTQQMFLPDRLKASSVLFKQALFQWSFAPFGGLHCVFTHWLLLRPPEPKD